MKNTSIIIFAAGMCVAFSTVVTNCSMSHEDLMDHPIEENLQLVQPYSISIEDAINSMTEFMSSGTKGTDETPLFEIENIIYIPNPLVQTKSSDMPDGENPYLLYAVNFRNDGGYAILAADSRLPSDIYSIVEQGNVTELDLYSEDDGLVSPPNMVYRAASGFITHTDSTVKDPRDTSSFHNFDQGVRPEFPDGEWAVERWGRG